MEIEVDDSPEALAVARFAYDRALKERQQRWHEMFMAGQSALWGEGENPLPVERMREYFGRTNESVETVVAGWLAGAGHQAGLDKLISLLVGYNWYDDSDMDDEEVASRYEIIDELSRVIGSAQERGLSLSPSQGRLILAFLGAIEGYSGASDERVLGSAASIALATRPDGWERALLNVIASGRGSTRTRAWIARCLLRSEETADTVRQLIERQDAVWEMMESWENRGPVSHPSYAPFVALEGSGEKRDAARELMAEVDAGKRPITSDVIRWGSVALCFAYEWGGEEGTSFIERHLDRLSAEQLAWLIWQKRGWSVQEVVDGLVQMRVIPRQPDFERFERKKGWQTRDEVGELWLLLALDDLIVGFDAESTDVPPPHDRLLIEFADASHGAFQPEYVSRLERRDWDLEYGTEHDIRFIESGRAYHFQVFTHGDWYDYRSVAQAANRALKENGRTERFVQLHLADQFKVYICCDPTLLKEASRQFAFALEDDMVQEALGKYPLHPPEWLREQAREALMKA